MQNPPASATAGNSFDAADTTKNFGPGTAGPSATQYYLSSNTTKEAGDVLLTGSRLVPALASGEQSWGTVAVTIPPTTPAGVYYLLACSDDLNLVAESNEGNNCGASATTVQVVP